MTNNDEKRGIDEKYSSATHATSLVVTAERGGAADVLIAAGWSDSRVGSALLRLHSEADAVERPRPMVASSIETLARVIAREQAQATGHATRLKPTPADFTAARAQAAQWFMHEQQLRLQKLKTLPEVRQKLIEWATEMRAMPEAADVVAAVLIFWLDPICPECGGTKYELMPGTNRQSARACKLCEGSGQRPVPGYHDGRALLGYIGDCINASRASMKHRLQQYPSRPKPRKPETGCIKNEQG